MVFPVAGNLRVPAAQVGHQASNRPAQPSYASPAFFTKPVFLPTSVNTLVNAAITPARNARPPTPTRTLVVPSSIVDFPAWLILVQDTIYQSRCQTRKALKRGG